MFPDYLEHTTNLRNLSPDDIAGICAIYPPGQLASDCDITPRHGFSPLCAAEQAAQSGCHTAAAGCDIAGGAGGRWAGVAAVAALLLAVRRKRSRG
jgi:hypothetical protein